MVPMPMPDTVLYDRTADAVVKSDIRVSDTFLLELTSYPTQLIRYHTARTRTVEHSRRVVC